jgi:hypothetical protein
MKSKLFITGLALVAVTTLASAQDSIPRGQRLLNGTGRGPAYVDANKNNICDNFEKGTPAGPRGQRNDNFIRGRGQGPGYCWSQNGRGQRNGQGQGLGRGRNFVDTDKNGICDYYESVPKK